MTVTNLHINSLAYDSEKGHKIDTFISQLHKDKAAMYVLTPFILTFVSFWLPFFSPELCLSCIFSVLLFELPFYFTFIPFHRCRCVSRIGLFRTLWSIRRLMSWCKTVSVWSPDPPLRLRCWSLRRNSQSTWPRSDAMRRYGCLLAFCAI
jgi:hypothetical protein